MFRVQTLVCLSAALRRRFRAEAWTLNEEQNLTKHLLTCLKEIKFISLVPPEIPY
jgi:hypothetical protein